jgi:hypothetical protein
MSKTPVPSAPCAAYRIITTGHIVEVGAPWTVAADQVTARKSLKKYGRLPHCPSTVLFISNLTALTDNNPITNLYCLAANFARHLMVCVNNKKLLLSIDQIVRHVEAQKSEPAFGEEKRSRVDRVAPEFVDSDRIPAVGVYIVAHAQGARADLIHKVEDGSFDRAFAGFRMDAVKNMNPCEVESAHWRHLSALQIVAERLQHYIFTRRMHPAVLDLYLRIQERQIHTQHLVLPNFEPQHPGIFALWDGRQEKLGGRVQRRVGKMRQSR